METFWCRSLRAETLQNLPTDQYDRLTDTDLRSAFIDHTGIILVMETSRELCFRSSLSLIHQLPSFMQKLLIHSSCAEKHPRLLSTPPTVALLLCWCLT